MDLRAILFNVNGTLVDIETNEGLDEIYRGLSNFLSYQGLAVTRREVRDQYFQLLQAQFDARGEEYPEFDAVALWGALLERWGGEQGRGPPAEKLKQLPLFLAEMFRSLSRLRLQLFPHVRQVLDQLRGPYRLAVVADAQSAYGLAELQAVGITDYFHPIIFSGEHGYRKPDARLFRKALEALQVRPDQAVHVGNDMFRDTFGAQQAGLRSVFFSSNQGEKQHPATEPDYVIYHFAELPQAVAFLKER
jgi:putative hydrolase of the HAD superfamily